VLNLRGRISRLEKILAPKTPPMLVVRLRLPGPEAYAIEVDGVPFSRIAGESQTRHTARALSTVATTGRFSTVTILEYRPAKSAA
jgi:hypothetical protein